MSKRKKVMMAGNGKRGNRLRYQVHGARSTRHNKKRKKSGQGQNQKFGPGTLKARGGRRETGTRRKAEARSRVHISISNLARAFLSAFSLINIPTSTQCRSRTQEERNDAVAEKKSKIHSQITATI